MISLEDRYGQLQNMMKMGPIGKVMQMIPGLGQMLPQVRFDVNDSVDDGGAERDAGSRTQQGLLLPLMLHRCRAQNMELRNAFRAS